MPRLILDIETAGKNLSDLDEVSLDYINHWAENSADNPEDIESEVKKIEEGFSISPLTAETVCIGLLNPDTKKGLVYYQAPGAEKKEFEDQGLKFITMTEPEMLQNFWEQVKFYDEFITFNGRNFDLPFLMLRSAIHQIRPSKNLLSNRYVNSQFKGAKHIDLLDQLQFYGATWGKRGYNLHMFCQAFNIQSPKGKGVSGAHVKDMFQTGQYEDIARYNVDDLFATAALYDYWQKYLNI